jgi:hypothetical protein
LNRRMPARLVESANETNSKSFTLMDSLFMVSKEDRGTALTHRICH